MQIYGYTRPALEHKAEIFFTARAKACEKYARHAAQKGWPKCVLGRASWNGQGVYIECKIVVPQEIVAQSGEICQYLNSLPGLSELEDEEDEDDD